jgi:predicted GNAT family N-acyltransferase
MEYKFSTEVLPETSELLELFRQTNWAAKRSVEDVNLMLKKTKIFVTIRDKDKLIGFGRAITDEVYRALLDDIVIDVNYRKSGLGSLVVKKLMDQLGAVEEVFLHAGDYLEEFYKKSGFKRTKTITMLYENS